MVSSAFTRWQEMPSAGLVSALGAFLAWGFLPLYWNLFSGLNPLEILSYRIIFSALILAFILGITHRVHEVVQGMRCFGTLWRMLASSLLIGINWYTFIGSTVSGNILESSLGYYITPLMSAFLGCAFLRERPSRIQIIGLLFALFGVGWSLFAYATVPWVALTLAGSFSLYAFIRKTVRMESVPGLFVETFMLLSFALAYVAWLTWHGQGFLCDFSLEIFGLLSLAGPLTSLPLVLFAFGARHLRLITLGLVQYIAPTCMLLLGLFVFDEPLTQPTLITFVCIWIGISIYSVEAFRLARLQRVRI